MSFLLGGLPFSVPAEEAVPVGFTNQSGEWEIADLGRWTVAQDTVSAQGRTELNLMVEEESLYANLTAFVIEPPFDIFSPFYQ
ncbi:MAG: hypothetical protein AAF555_03995 [Verrucomicrobiota bacterium]